MTKRDIERRKYQELYGNIQKDEPNVYYPTDEKYGEGTHGNGVHIFMLKLFKPESVLDVGCGKDNTFCKLIRDEYKVETNLEQPKLCGVDFASKPKKLKDIEFKTGRAEELPFKDEEFDVVTSFDMLEHILPEDIDTVLSELFRVAKKGIVVTVAHHQVKRKLHNIVEPEEWWDKKFFNYGNPIKYLKYIIIKKEPSWKETKIY